MCRTTFATRFDGDIRDAEEIFGHHRAALSNEIFRRVRLPPRMAIFALRLALQAQNLAICGLESRRAVPVSSKLSGTRLALPVLVWAPPRS
jgi:hypothetical protein